MACRVLERHPRAHIYMVGVRPQDHATYPGHIAHERLHCLGPILDPVTWQAAADLYLEGFPCGSQTACLESVLHGVVPVLALAPDSSLLVAHDLAISDRVHNPRSEEEYLDIVDFWLGDSEARRSFGVELSERIRSYHTGDMWRRHLDAFYAEMQRLKHAATCIPETAVEQTTEDRAIAAWHLVHYGGRDVDALAMAYVRTALCSAAYSLRQASEYASALRLLRAAKDFGGWTCDVTLGMAKLGPHWALRRLQRLSGSTNPAAIAFPDSDDPTT
jgi:hypothetical protein